MPLREIFSSAKCTSCNQIFNRPSQAKRHVENKPSHMVRIEYTIENREQREYRRKLIRQLLDNYAKEK